MAKFLRFFIKTLTTFFYLGYLPFIPGTFGSLGGIFLFLLIRGNIFLHIFLTLILLCLGLISTTAAEEIFKQKDSPCIVIDEVTGMLLSLLFIPYDPKLIIMGFILFRALDALKPYPAGRLQRLRGGMGVMSDDIIAALYTNIILQVVFRLVSFRVS